jgi:PBP1b-binding outer membrane lipoprotein LpoB
MEIGMKKIKISLLLGVLILAGCATARPELKAPCNPLQCKDRVNVNTWYKG